MIHHHDVIVIGGGLTGLRAALRISEAGQDCAVVSKVHPLRSHSVAAQGGMNASLGNVEGEDGTRDSWKNHAYDTVKGSDYLADQDAVEQMCREAPGTVIELEHMGMVWSRLENGKIAQRPFGGAGFPRTCYAADRTGHNVLNTLYENVVDRKIPVYEELFVTSLVIEEERCIGCTALELMTGKIHGFLSKAVLMATGGFGRLFSKSTNALINTGDGQALALCAGAMLKDMEFVQFHPTTLYDTNILITEGARGEGGILINKDGERFMKRYAPHTIDLAPRDVVARSIEQEIAEGRGYDGGYVILDLRHLGSDRIKERLPGIRQIALDFAGVDPINEMIPVQPGQHYSMGGIDVDTSGVSSIPGLYAAGECACISVHGANRLGGNSLLETVVFGRLVAEKIIYDVRNITSTDDESQNATIITDDIQNTSSTNDKIQNTTSANKELIKTAIADVNDKIKEILQREGEEHFFKIKDRVNHTMFHNFGLFREKQKMQKGLSEIEDLQKMMLQVSLQNKERKLNQALIRFLELEGMLLLAEAVAIGAIAREESRGSHTRTDFPERDDLNFLKHTLIGLRDGKMNISYKQVKLGMFQPMERVY